MLQADIIYLAQKGQMYDYTTPPIFFNRQIIPHFLKL